MPPSDRAKATTPPKQTKPAQQTAAFHIGDGVKSDDETDAKLSESTSQLSLKSVNGMWSRCLLSIDVYCI